MQGTVLQGSKSVPGIKGPRCLVFGIHHCGHPGHFSAEGAAERPDRWEWPKDQVRQVVKLIEDNYRG